MSEGPTDGLEFERSSNDLQLKAAEERRRQLEEQRADIARAARESVLRFGNITTIQPKPGATLTPEEIIAGMQQKVETIRRFEADLAQMIKDEISPDLIKQFAEAGPGTEPPSQ